MVCVGLGQVEGVQFMYDNLVVNAEQLRGGGDGAKGNGCILAHCMGLGKTLQVQEKAMYSPCVPLQPRFAALNTFLPPDRGVPVSALGTPHGILTLVPCSRGLQILAGFCVWPVLVGAFCRAFACP